MSEDTMSGVAEVFALEGIALTEEIAITPEPEPTPTVTEPDTIEQLKADIMASADPALIARFEQAMAGLHAIAKTWAEKDAEIRTLISGQELWFVQRFPDAALAYYNSLSAEDKAALTETLRVQYELATSSPAWSSGDGKMHANPMAVTPPTLGGRDNGND